MILILKNTPNACIACDATSQFAKESNIKTIVVGECVGEEQSRLIRRNAAEKNQK
jgi:tRNA U34 2-thiouridine synthase MnmA/TrmU